MGGRKSEWFLNYTKSIPKRTRNVCLCVCVDGDGQLKKDEGNGPPFHPSLTVVIKRASKQLHLAKFTTVKGVNRVVKLVFLFYFSTYTSSYVYGPEGGVQIKDIHFNRFPPYFIDLGMTTSR
jgi:hypothetical protein